jgi:hypothetical protein
VLGATVPPAPVDEHGDPRPYEDHDVHYALIAISGAVSRRRLFCIALRVAGKVAQDAAVPTLVCRGSAVIRFALARWTRLAVVLGRGLMRRISGTGVVLDPLAPWTSSSGGSRKVQVAGPNRSRGVTPGLPVGGDRGRQTGTVKRLGPDQRGQQLGSAGGA